MPFKSVMRLYPYGWNRSCLLHPRPILHGNYYLFIRPIACFGATSTRNFLRAAVSPKLSSVRRRLSSEKQQSVTNRKILAHQSLIKEMTSKTKEQFLEFYPELLQQLKSSPVLQELPDMQKWIEKIVDYNVQGGKMNRGIAVIECYISLACKKQSAEKDLKVAIALGWALEMIQAFFLVADDIMDDSHTRRMKPCWFRTNNLGVKAFNDAILLESAVYQIISVYCRDRPYYLPVLELFHDVTMKTSLGQAMDLQSAPGLGESPDLNKFTSTLYDAIVKYKTAYYSFYLPVAIAMQMVGIEEKSLYKKAEDILLPMGHFFQVQDDYLDCFGDPAVTGKIGTDIEDGKCTWLVVTALAICSPTQRLIINEHYGSKETESVNRIKDVYTDLDIPKLYSTYEEDSYEQLCVAIKAVETQLPASFFQGFMDKIYKRSQ